MLAMLGVVCLLSLIALAGCGVTTGGAGLGSPAGSSTAVTHGGASINPCPGKPATLAKAPNVLLSLKDSHKQTQVHPGDVVQVELAAQMHWSVNLGSSAATLKPLAPQGVMDSQTSSCRWLFQAAQPGLATLSFIGTPLCDPTQPCLAIAEDEEFTIQVS
jgi:hypothetical protein